MPWPQPGATPPTQTTPAATVTNPFTLYSYDLLTGAPLGSVPGQGLQFAQTINTPGSGTLTINLEDPRVQASQPLALTVPNRTFICVDYLGALVWGGVVTTRRWQVDASATSTTRALTVQMTELWSYFQQRVQATDYSSPPFSGINPSAQGMPLWTQTPWDAGLVTCQLVADAIGYSDTALQPAGNLLGGLGILYNSQTPSSLVLPASGAGYTGTAASGQNTITSMSSVVGVATGQVLTGTSIPGVFPSGTTVSGVSGSTVTVSQNASSSGSVNVMFASPPAPAADWVAVSYPFSTVQTVDSIVSQLTQLGLGVGFDLGVDVAYSGASGTPPIATVNLSYPRRGRTVADNKLVLEMSTARSYEFPEDGSQTANQVYEIGGSGAIVVSENANPLNQGYPLWERVVSRSNAQSQNLLGLLSQTGVADLSLYAYPPVAPTVTIGVADTNLPLGSFIVGDDVTLLMPSSAPDGGTFDPRFPSGLDQEWRIVGWSVNAKDAGDAVLTLTLNQPPATQLIAPAI